MEDQIMQGLYNGTILTTIPDGPFKDASDAQLDQIRTHCKGV